MIYPLITTLGRRGARIDAVVSDNGSHDIMAAHPFIRNVYPWREKRSAMMNIWNISCKLRKTVYDAAYSASPSWTRESIVAMACRANRKEGFAGDQRYYLDKILIGLGGITRRSRESDHDFINNRNLFGLGAQEVDLNKNNLLFLERKAQCRAGALCSREIPEGGGAFLIALHPGSKAKERRWSTKKFSELANRLAKKHDFVRFVIIGGADEVELMESLRKDIKGGATVARGLSLIEAALLLRNCGIFIGNDSAPMHFAALQYIPNISIWGLSNYRRTSPVGNRSVIVRKRLPCSPCYDAALSTHMNCRTGLECIHTISVDEVFSVADSYVDSIRKAGSSVSNTVLETGSLRAEREILETGALVLHLIPGLQSEGAPQP